MTQYKTYTVWAAFLVLSLSSCSTEKMDQRSRVLTSDNSKPGAQRTGENADVTADLGETVGDTKGKDSTGGEENEIIDDVDHPDGHPTQNGDAGKGGDEDEVPVEPEEVLPCRWFDPNNPEFAEEINGGPVGTAIPIDRYVGNGRWEDDNFIFTFITYHKDKVPAPGAQKLDEMAGWASYYTAIILDAKSETCTAIASGQIADRRWMGGCFKLTTQIRMADGSDRMIALLKAGDEVWNPITQRSQRIKRVIEGPEADKPMYEIGTLGSFTVVTSGHPFMTVAGLKTAQQLSANDLIIGEDGGFHRVTTWSERSVNPTQVVRNIELESESHTLEDHQVLADGVVAGDLYLQELLLNK